MAKRKERQFDPNSIRRVVAKIEWSDGELFLRIGFIVTNSWLPAWKAVKVDNGRGDVENRIKEGKNTLRWDKTRRHRFAASQARLLMGVWASNLLHMLRQFYLMSEEVKRSMEWLIKRLVKVGARIAYHARKWYVHVASAFSLARYCQVALGLRAMRIFWLTESHMARYAQERVNKTLFVDATMVLPCCCLAARDHQSSHWAPDGRCQDGILGQTYL